MTEMESQPKSVDGKIESEKDDPEAQFESTGSDVAERENKKKTDRGQEENVDREEGELQSKLTITINYGSVTHKHAYSKIAYFDNCFLLSERI